MNLIALGNNGSLEENRVLRMPTFISEVIASVRALFDSQSYVAPWVAYVAEIDGACVGFCTFKSSPIGGAVEIAYATSPEYERRGVATEMARRLISIARATEPDIVIHAQTLPEHGASTTVLKKLGFIREGVIQHPADGCVWAWRLPPRPSPLFRSIQ